MTERVEAGVSPLFRRHWSAQLHATDSFIAADLAACALSRIAEARPIRGRKATAEWFPAKERGFARRCFSISARRPPCFHARAAARRLRHLLFSGQMAFVLTGSIGWFGFHSGSASINPPTNTPQIVADNATTSSSQDKPFAGDGTDRRFRTSLRRRNF